MAQGPGLGYGLGPELGYELDFLPNNFNKKKVAFFFSILRLNKSGVDFVLLREDTREERGKKIHQKTLP